MALPLWRAAELSCLGPSRAQAGGPLFLGTLEMQWAGTWPAHFARSRDKAPLRCLCCTAMSSCVNYLPRSAERSGEEVEDAPFVLGGGIGVQVDMRCAGHR